MSTAISQCDKQLLSKIEVLKKGILDLRRQASNYESEISELKATITMNDKKANEFKSQINELKEQVVTKEELIAKWKEQLINIRDKNGQPQLKSLISNFWFDNNEDSHQDDKSISWYQSENIRLKEEISSLRTEKEFASEKLRESLATYNEIKEKFDLRVKESQESNEKNTMKKIEGVRDEYIDKVNQWYKDWSERDQIITSWNERIILMTDLNKKFDVITVEYNKNLQDWKNTIEKQKNQIKEALNDKDTFSSTIEIKNAEISALKQQVVNYQKEWKKYKPLDFNHVFKGYWLSNGKDCNISRKIDLTFNKNDKTWWIVEEKEKELLLNNKSIVLIMKDTQYINQVWITFLQNNREISYWCRYDENEITYILQFYDEIKYRNKIIENQMMGLSFRDWFP